MARFTKSTCLTPLALAAVLLLSGCASFSQDGGMQAVSALADARTGAPQRWPTRAARKNWLPCWPSLWMPTAPCASP